MTLLEKHYPESKFGGFTDVDATICFYARINSLIQKHQTLLDVGCGRGEYEEDTCEYRKNLRIFKGKCSKVVGIDVDPGASNNPYIDEFHLIKGNSWTEIPDESIDVIVCDYVLEHIEHPDILFLEFKRVLKRNGIICARTPNLFSYFGMISNLIPDRLHTKILSKIQPSRKAEDVFPKFYRCNSIRKVKGILSSSGFNGIAYGYEDEPAYFSFSNFIFSVAKLFHSFTPRYFRTQLFIFASKV